MTADLADLLTVGPLGRRVTDIVTRWAFDGHDGPTMAAARILADPAIAAGLTATPILEQLRARHQPRPWGQGSAVVVCSCGSGAFDACPDAAILTGS